MSYDTDSKKLTNRIDAHKNFAKFDVNKWALQQVSLKNGENLLEIGCGTGEQLIKFAESCTESKIYGIDSSEDSLEIIKKHCKEKGINNLITIQGNMDGFPKLLGSTKDFDVVNSCFALYYSKNIPKIILDIKNILNENGRLFVCGPILGNNSELIEFQSNISKDSIKNVPFAMTEDILPEISKNFQHVKQDIFLNPVVFPNGDTVMNYWKSYYLYNSKIEQDFFKALKEHFNNNSEFVTTKKILGILGKK